MYEDKEKCYNTFDKILDLRVRYNKYRKTFKLLKMAFKNDINKCLKYAIKHFYKHFIYNINNILKLYPPDCINKKTNMKFWTGVNRIPHPLEFDLTKTINFEYIESFSFLLSKALSINNSFMKTDYIYEFCNNYKMKELKKKTFESKIFYENKIKEIKVVIDDYLNTNSNNKKILFNPIPYQKDSTEEKIINFMFSSSNLRARNYNIPEEEKMKINSTY